MSKEVPELIDLVAHLGPPPEGVDHVDYAIASLPPKDLTKAARNSTFSYEGLKAIIDRDPEFLSRFDAMPHPSKSFADEILVRQQQLSKTRRRLATLTTALALGVGGFAFGYKSDATMQREVFGHNHPVDVREEVRDGAIFGGLVATLGGFVAAFAGLEMSGRLARRPAQKIVDRTRTSTE